MLWSFGAEGVWGLSVEGERGGGGCREGGEGLLYVGSMLSIFLPALEATNSLLMKRPMGWVYLRPLGAVRVMERSDMMYADRGNRQRQKERPRVLKPFMQHKIHDC